FKPMHLAFLRIGYSWAYARKYSFGLRYEYQTWGIMNLQNDAGHILIKPETIIDKIHDLINPIEIDFPDDPNFSRNYYVVTNDESKARSEINNSFREQVKKLRGKEFIIEIFRDNLIIGDRKIIDEDSAISFVRFMNDVSTG